MREPTTAEIADALDYILVEFELKNGIVTDVHWSEGLAFARRGRGSDYVEAAAQLKSQLTSAQWKDIAAQADKLRQADGMQPRFLVGKMR